MLAKKKLIKTLMVSKILPKNEFRIYQDAHTSSAHIIQKECAENAIISKVDLSQLTTARI